MAAQEPGIDRTGEAVAENFSEGNPKQLAGQFMGFGALLLQWRKTAAGRPTQERTAKAMGISVRTYRKIEKGAVPPRLTPAQFEGLAKLFGLDEEGRHALMLHNIGSTLAPPRGTSQPQLQKALRLLIDRQMPSPAYLCDQHWNILGFNTAMAEWWPWVMEPGANLILWALLSPAARTQYQDWDMHAAAYVKILKFAEAARRDDPELRELIEKVKKDPDVRHIWDTENAKGETRDGHVFRMNVPTLDWETVEVVSHVLYPASMPECRFVVITWVEGGEDEHDALGDARNAWAATAADQDDVEAAQRHAQNRVAEDAATRWRREAASLASRMVVATPEQAAALAGNNGIPMPAISKLMGPDAQLTLAPDRSIVVWAVEEVVGCWSVTYMQPATVIARVPRDAVHGACLAEVLQLVRAALPAEADAAIARIAQLLEERDTEQRVLREVLNTIENDVSGQPVVREADRP
ncbi:helix-turn-helix domain-containing protein [Streptomyces sp. NBC_01304]|uniref:helix-turn-helix domain-containing protein n=1 Tax=Streptomyces sp. NBC_01304 TaxID=2903818 RepID=UPI002E0E0141|nr:helix-turn-helix transcriptional regulator [Streptomyces sp. NBC_01304]